MTDNQYSYCETVQEVLQEFGDDRLINTRDINQAEERIKEILTKNAKFVSLFDLPVKHKFYQDYDSHPIALGFNYRYKITETYVERFKNGYEEYYDFHHLVQ